MKHLRKISEELKSSVYKSAADKLSKMGHKKRVFDLEEWSNIKAEREQQEKKSKLISQLESIGTFNMDINNGEYIGDFYINLSFDVWQLNDHYNDWMSDGGSGLFLYLNIGLLPLDDKTFEHTDFANSRGKNDDGTYWSGEIGLHLGNYPGDVNVEEMYNKYEEDNLSPDLPHPKNPKGDTSFSYWELPFLFSDRRNAAKFRKSLIDIFRGDVIYKETTENPGGLKGDVIDILCSERPIYDIGEFEEFIKSLGRININRFFKD